MWFIVKLCVDDFLLFLDVREFDIEVFCLVSIVNAKDVIFVMNIAVFVQEMIHI